MTRVEQSGQEGGNAVAEKRIGFTYNSAGQWDTITRYADLAATEFVAETSYTYDNASRLTVLSHTQGATTLAGYAWTCDSAGRVTQFDSTIDGTVDYSYDDTNQLTGADYDYQTDESYSYDENGNRTNTGYSTGDDNRLLSDGTYTYAYDAEGNRTARFVDEDESGTLNTGDTAITEYTWDYRNRLTSVTERATYGGSATKVTEFAYDDLNRLMRETADPDGAGEAAAEETYFAYDENQIVLKFNASEASDLSHRYLCGPAVDQILSDEQVTSLNNPGSVLWPLADNLGTVRDIATYDSQTDTTTVANHRVYDAYGNLTSQTNSAIDHLFGFTGRMHDDATGLQNNLNRWYDSAVGRWLSRDPIGFRGGDANLFRYVGNEPTGGVDPSGMATQRYLSRDYAPQPIADVGNTAWTRLARSFNAAGTVAVTTGPVVRAPTRNHPTAYAVTCVVAGSALRPTPTNSDRRRQLGREIMEVEGEIKRLEWLEEQVDNQIAAIDRMIAGISYIPGGPVTGSMQSMMLICATSTRSALAALDSQLVSTIAGLAVYKGTLEEQLNRLQ